jgi:hypothetical protein
MPPSPSTENYTLGKGKLYFARLVDGVNMGEIDLGNTPAFTLSPVIESLDHFESMAGIREKDKSVDITVGLTGKFALDEYSVENIRLALLGTTAATYTQPTGHQVNEPMTARLGNWVKLSRVLIHTVTVTNSTGLITYIRGTDYSVDEPNGRILAIVGGGITDGEALLVDFNFDACEYPLVNLIETSNVEGLIRFVGDPAVGQSWHLVLWKAKLKPTGDIPLISEEWGQLEFEFEALRDAANYPNSPWGQLTNETTNDSIVS